MTRNATARRQQQRNTDSNGPLAAVATVLVEPAASHPLKLVGVSYAAELTDESPWTWRDRCYRGKVASVRTGVGRAGRLLIPLAEVERYIREHLRPAVTA